MAWINLKRGDYIAVTLPGQDVPIKGTLMHDLRSDSFVGTGPYKMRVETQRDPVILELHSGYTVPELLFSAFIARMPERVQDAQD